MSHDQTGSNNPYSVPAATSGSRSKLLSTNFKNFLSKPAITHPQKALTIQLHNAEQRSNMSSTSGQGAPMTGDIATKANSGFPKDSNAPGEQFEPRQTATSEDYEPDPSKSLKLSPQRQALVDDVSLAIILSTSSTIPFINCLAMIPIA